MKVSAVPTDTIMFTLRRKDGTEMEDGNPKALLAVVKKEYRRGVAIVGEDLPVKNVGSLTRDDLLSGVFVRIWRDPAAHRRDKGLISPDVILACYRKPHQ